MYSRLKILLINVLNMFARPATANSTGRSARMMVGLMAFGCVALCAWMTLYKVPKKFVIMVDEYTLGDVDSLTIGEDDDVVMPEVPKSFLTVRMEGGTAHWRVNDAHSDTLQYFKINNENPNRFEVRDDASQKISITLPQQNGKPLQLELTGEEVWKEWKDFKKQSDVLVRHFAAHYKCAKEGATHTDSVEYKGQMDEPDVRSFFHATHGMLGGVSSISLIILDKHTKIDGNGYQFGGETRGDETRDKRGKCKVQFFTVNSYSYKDDEHDDGYFEVDDVNYAMKATPKLTKWGAGHVMLMSGETGNGIRVVLPKAIGYVGTIDTLKAKATKTSDVITFQQTEEAFPTPSDMYLPYFSRALNRGVCSLKLNGNGLVVSDNNSNEYGVENGDMPLLPTLKPITMQSGNNSVKARIGIISGQFMLSYIYLPLIVAVILLIITLGRWSPFRAKSMGGTYSYNQLQAFPGYVAMIILLGMIYCICKSMIAFKLSYTYPYFENMTAITPFDTAMMLLVFFTMAMIINYPLTSFTPKKAAYSRRRQAKNRKGLYTGIVLTVVFAALTAVFFLQPKWGIQASIIDAYFPDKIDITANWMSDTAYGVKDNHRTVPYALITVEMILLMVLFVINITGTAWLKTLWGKAQKNITALGEKAEDFVRKKTSTIKWSAVLTQPTHAHNVLARIASIITSTWKILYPSHIIIIIVLAAGGSALGNFGTAFISLGVILGLTQALSNAKFDENTPRYATLCQMIIISLAYIAGAMYADNGYMTNYLGFIMCVLTFYFIIKHPGRYGTRLTNEEKRERKWVVRTLIAIVVMIVMMPWLCSQVMKTESVNYSRLSRRVMLYSSFNDLQRSGYRYAESDAEFMAVMSHYMQDRDGSDPLSNDTHPMHASISSGQSPVVLNDLSVPVAFLGSYGITCTTVVYFLLLIALLTSVIQFSFAYTGHSEPRLTKAMQWRLLAVFMWVGTSLYIYLSYIDQLPFTGRLNPGFGVDAVGEALETAFLLAFMTAVTVESERVKE